MKLLYLLIFFLILCRLPAGATHIVGGDFNLQHLQGNEYLLTLKVFRDCKNGVPYFNLPLYVGMYDKGTHAKVDTFKFNQILSNDTLEFQGGSCYTFGIECTHIGLYQRVIELDSAVFNSSNGYYFSWERCCRNRIIRNIEVLNGIETITGMTFYMEIPPLNQENSTPVFAAPPLTFLCVNHPFSFNYNVTETDGDSLVYSLVQPLKGTTTANSPNDPGQINYPIINSGPYSLTQWRPGYSLQNIMDGNPSLAIDSATGQLTVTPTQQGIYVVAIKVEEYRNGVKLGEVRRELQYTVGVCQTNQIPELSQNVKGTVYTVHPSDTFRLAIETEDPNQGDSVYLSITGDIFDDQGKIDSPYAFTSPASGLTNAVTNLEWTPTCDHVTGDTLEVRVRVVDNGCPFPKADTAIFYLVVVPPPPADPPEFLCYENYDNGEVRLSWQPATNGEYGKSVVLGRKSADGEAEDIATIEDSSTEYLDFPPDGKYCYYLYSINICGIRGDSVETCMIDFSLGEDIEKCEEEEATLEAMPGATNYLWSTGESGRSIRVAEPGEYSVEAWFPEACEPLLATVEVKDQIVEELGEIPNVFTPNNDGYNDRYRLPTENLKELSLTIYNRWGEILYEFSGPEDSWDGNINGRPAPPGGYYWLLTYRARCSQTERQLHGTVTLIR
ncbi:MAG: gliding motility-associated C-terminal domain-containing protein [Bacteroidia bacterium]